MPSPAGSRTRIAAAARAGRDTLQVTLPGLLGWPS